MVQLFYLHALSLSECYIAARAEKLFISQTSLQLRFMCELMCLHTIWDPELKSTHCCCCRVCRGSVCRSATEIAGWLQRTERTVRTAVASGVHCQDGCSERSAPSGRLQRVECTVHCLVMSFQSLWLWQQLWVFRTQLKWHAISIWDSSFLILLFPDCARDSSSCGGPVVWACPSGPEHAPRSLPPRLLWTPSSLH